MLLRAKNCAEKFNVHKNTWWRWTKEDPRAPQPAIKSRGYTAWKAEDVEAYARLLEVEGR